MVIQHPGGKVERLHGPATAGEVMRGNPGHYVALVVLRVSKTDPRGGGGGGARVTKVKLLKPEDALLLGQVYRLVTSQGACLPSASWPDSSSAPEETSSSVPPLMLSAVARAEVAKAIQARRQDKARRCGEAPDNPRPSPPPVPAAGGRARGQSAAADQVSAR